MARAIPGQSRVFLGDAHNPLLAPRGVHLVGGRLFVADTGQNRVFIWNTVPTTLHQAPDIVLGQVEKGDTDRNAGGKVSGSTLIYPSGLWSDGSRLVVCDAWNHRVLIWNTLPTEDGQPADLVLGQPDFLGNAPNVSGIGSTPSAQSLNWPYGVDSDGERLFVADTGNRRVLVFDPFPTESFAAARGVIGKADFADRDYDHQQAIWPYSVKVGPDGELAITDTQYYRVLYYASWSSALHLRTRPIVIGQENLEANGQNQFRWFPEANTLNWCYDTAFHAGGLLVADTGNSRVLHFSHLPTANNPAADALLGQASFNVGIENRNSIKASPESMYWPFHLAIEEGLLAVADTGNHRIILHKFA
ncbi:NHL repeat-containing protein [Lewinella lacunae]|uniref:NHL repeat-containing protein n=2 Tax=Neolewinella lacunae TaxID=1517758 RepID=A0A923PJ92_9BACT|nr:NHL repeat-containing protein [Neolewinella lacunae]